MDQAGFWHTYTFLDLSTVCCVLRQLGSLQNNGTSLVKCVPNSGHNFLSFADLKTSCKILHRCTHILDTNSSVFCQKWSKSVQLSGEKAALHWWQEMVWRRLAELMHGANSSKIVVCFSHSHISPKLVWVLVSYNRKTQFAPPKVFFSNLFASTKYKK